MKYLTIETIKKHLNIDPWFDGDDEYIEMLGDVAEEIVATHLDDSLDNKAMENGGILPAPIQHACLLYIGQLYMNREAVSFTSAQELPLAYRYLLQPYKNYKTSEI